MVCAVSGRCHGRDPPASIDQRARTDQPTGSSSRGGGSGGAGMSLTGGAAATSSTRRPSSRISGVPHRLHDMTSPNCDHFQHVGQQTFITTAHSHQRDGLDPAPYIDGAETVTGSAQTGTDPVERAFSRHDPVHSRRRRRRSPSACRMQQPGRHCASHSLEYPGSLRRGHPDGRTVRDAIAHGIDRRIELRRAAPGVSHLHLTQRGMGPGPVAVRRLRVRAAGEHDRCRRVVDMGGRCGPAGAGAGESVGASVCRQRGWMDIGIASLRDTQRRSNLGRDRVSGSGRARIRRRSRSSRRASLCGGRRRHRTEYGRPCCALREPDER